MRSFITVYRVDFQIIVRDDRGVKNGNGLNASEVPMEFVRY